MVRLGRGLGRINVKFTLSQLKSWRMCMPARPATSSPLRRRWGLMIPPPPPPLLIQIDFLATCRKLQKMSYTPAPTCRGEEDQTGRAAKPASRVSRSPLYTSLSARFTASQPQVSVYSSRGGSIPSRPGYGRFRTGLLAIITSSLSCV